MKILVFDVETNGKAINFRAPMTQVDNWPRVTQIAWLTHDTETKEDFEFSTLIKPDGWTVPTAQFFIDNNMSTERCEAAGIPMPDVLKLFFDCLERCDLLVAHNMAFDYNVVGAEAIRYKLKAKKKVDRYCTMQHTTNVLKIPGRYGDFKWPKLEEAYKHYYGEIFSGAHDALVDVRACRDVFLKVYKEESIKQ